MQQKVLTDITRPWPPTLPFPRANLTVAWRGLWPGVRKESMAPSMYTRCVDILYMLHAPAFHAKSLRCPGLRYILRPVRRVCALVKAVADLVWEVAAFMWAPYQFLIIDGDTPASVADLRRHGCRLYCWVIS